MDEPVVIDLSADLGEGSGHDDDLLGLVTSANICCGAHAGDDATMRRACAAAAEHGVVIGAHPGYPDREHFGRLPLTLSHAALAKTLAEQFAALAAAAAAAGASIAYVKAHGALYHRAATDPVTAAALLAAAPSPTVVLGPPQAVVPTMSAGATPTFVVEGFADRAYAIGPGGLPTLVDRGEPGAVLGHDEAVAQALALATTGIAVAADGTPVAIHPRSLCVHGDTAGAVALARDIRQELQRSGVVVRAFAR